MGLLSAFRRTFAGGETRARASSLGIRDDAGTVRRWPRFEDLLEDPARVDTSEPPALAADDPFADDLRTWWRDGFVVKKSFAPAHLVDAYTAVRGALGRPEGWHSPVPYLHVREIRDLCLFPDLMRLLERLIGAEMGLHLNLTGWMSSERTWHQDGYLNPEFVGTWYCGVWVALDDVHPDCGPLEVVPGSHRWGAMSGAKVRSCLTPDEARQIGHEHAGDVGHWAKYAEPFVTRAFDERIARSGVEPVPFLGGKGDVLVWHSRLAHRGSTPRRYDIERRSLISHYSAVAHRPDMTFVREGAGAYATFDIPLY